MRKLIIRRYLALRRDFFFFFYLPGRSSKRQEKRKSHNKKKGSLLQSDISAAVALLCQWSRFCYFLENVSSRSSNNSIANLGHFESFELSESPPFLMSLISYFVSLVPGTPIYTRNSSSANNVSQNSS